jgi:hypothetical protein
MRVLTITHTDDLPQLLLQAASLEKFWKGSRYWTIVIESEGLGQKKCSDFIEQKIRPMFSSNWTVKVVSPKCNLETVGWHRQQLYKLVYSASNSEEWVLVLDAKNFLIRPINESFFVAGNKIRHLPIFTDNEFNKTSHIDSREVLGITDNDIPIVSPMTPWVWKSSDIKELLDRTGISLSKWVDNRAAEYCLFWNMFYKKYRWEPDMFASGFWANECPYDFAETLVDKVKDCPDIKIWVHHRYAYDPILRNMTSEVLKSVGIDSRIVDQWNTEYEQIFETHRDSIIVDRIPMWPHLNKEQT